MLEPTREQYEVWPKFALGKVKALKWKSDHLSLGPEIYVDQALKN